MKPKAGKVKSKFVTTSYLLILISLGYVASDLYLPALPALAEYFHTSDNNVQLTLFSYLLSFALTPLIFGPLSDHMGRKKVLLGGISLGILASFGCLCAKNIQWLIASRFFQGIGTGAVLISSRATVSDMFTGKALAKQMSLMTMMMPLILAVAPTIGGMLQQNFGWRSVFIFLTCYSILIFFLVLRKPESLHKQNHEDISQIFKKYRVHFANKLFLIYGVNLALPFLGLFAYLTASPFLFQEIIGLSPMQYGSLALLVGATIMFTGYINIRLLNRISPTQILALGSSLIVAGGCLLTFFHIIGVITIWSVLLPSLLFFSCMPFCIANAASKCMALVSSNFGTASALLTTFQFLVGAMGSFVFSLLPHESALSLGICFIVVGMLSLLNLRYASSLEASNVSGLSAL